MGITGKFKGSNKYITIKPEFFGISLSKIRKTAKEEEIDMEDLLTDGELHISSAVSKLNVIDSINMDQEKSIKIRDFFDGRYREIFKTIEIKKICLKGKESQITAVAGKEIKNRIIITDGLSEEDHKRLVSRNCKFIGKIPFIMYGGGLFFDVLEKYSNKNLNSVAKKIIESFGLSLKNPILQDLENYLLLGYTYLFQNLTTMEENKLNDLIDGLFHGLSELVKFRNSITYCVPSALSHASEIISSTRKQCKNGEILFKKKDKKEPISDFISGEIDELKECFSNKLPFFKDVEEFTFDKNGKMEAIFKKKEIASDHETVDSVNVVIEVVGLSTKATNPSKV
jgi:hypothetical protein